MTIILSDFSQMVISSVAATAKEFRCAEEKDLIKHIALNQLLALKKRFKGKMILCCDGKNYWRKSEFKWYKGHRKHKRDSNFLNWDVVFETLNELIEELSENFPYVVLKVDGAEADDIIASLVKYFSENEVINTGLIDEPQQIIIASTDSDFQQLQKYKNVSQWNNVSKKMIVCKNPKEYLIEHICLGDVGDNIPSIVNNDTLAEDRANNIATRAKPFKSIRLKDFIINGYDACLTEEEQRNYRRNEKLIDFDFIPNTVYNTIINTYKTYEIKGTKAKVFNYLNSHRMKLLLNFAADF